MRVSSPVPFTMRLAHNNIHIAISHLRFAFWVMDYLEKKHVTFKKVRRERKAHVERGGNGREGGKGRSKRERRIWKGGNRKRGRRKEK